MTFRSVFEVCQTYSGNEIVPLQLRKNQHKTKYILNWRKIEKTGQLPIAWCNQSIFSFFLRIQSTLKQQFSPAPQRQYSVDSWFCTNFSNSERERSRPKYNNQLARNYPCFMELATKPNIRLFVRSFSDGSICSHPAFPSASEYRIYCSGAECRDLQRLLQYQISAEYCRWKQHNSWWLTVDRSCRERDGKFLVTCINQGEVCFIFWLIQDVCAVCLAFSNCNGTVSIRENDWENSTAKEILIWRV